MKGEEREKEREEKEVRKKSAAFISDRDAVFFSQSCRRDILWQLNRYSVRSHAGGC